MKGTRHSPETVKLREGSLTALLMHLSSVTVVVSDTRLPASAASTARLARMVAGCSMITAPPPSAHWETSGDTRR